MKMGASFKCAISVLVFAVCVGLPLHAGAVTQCAASGGTLPQAIVYPGTIAVASNVQIGDTIPGTSRPFSVAGQCVLGKGSPVPIAVGSKIVMCYTNGSSSEVMPGVYSTNIPGIGVRVRDSTGNALTGAWPSACAAGIGTIGTGGAYAFSGTMELVRIVGTIPASAALSPSTMTWLLSPYQSGITLNIDSGGDAASEISPSGNIAVRGITCTASAPTTVVLPAVSASALPNVGATAGATPFSLQLVCDGSAVVGVTLDTGGGGIVSAMDGLFANAVGAGMASGVGVQIVDHSYSPVPLQNRQAQGTLVANSMATYPYYARYKRTDALSPGAVTVLMTYTFDYQ